MKKEIEKCRICQEQFGFEPRPLVWGNHNAKIVQISQAPSLTAHKTRKLWADKGGEKLKHQWYQISDKEFYNPKNFYITALAHCYPGKNTSGDNAPPLNCAKTWLEKEIEVLNPELFVVIGGLATKFLFPGKNFSNLIMENQILKGKLCFVLPHPSPINIKWFKDHPEFETTRLPKIRKEIKKIINRELTT